MNPMSANMERIAGARLNELGSPVISDINYRHHKADKSKYQLKQNEVDCITCKKTTQRPQCKIICGNAFVKTNIKAHRTTKSTNVALTNKDQ